MKEINYQERVDFLLNAYSKNELKNALGITYPTLKSRIEKFDWRAKELQVINELYTTLNKE